MPIVFDNIVFSLQRVGGVSRFWSKIISPHIGKKSTLFVERADGKNNQYRQELMIESMVRDYPLPFMIARYINFKRHFFKGKYIFHSSYYRINDAPGCINVTTVHDLIYEKFFKGIRREVHVWQKTTALKKSDTIVCVSENTRKDLYSYYPFCRDKKVLVIPNGVDVSLKSKGIPPGDSGLKGEMKEPYFLYVGHRGWIKGFDRVYDAVEILGRKIRCLVVGGPFSQDEMREIKSRRLGSLIVNVGKVDDSTLHLLYSGALFSFFPSRYEGFGIPPLEAMVLGCPVLASNSSSIPEVVGDAGILFNADDVLSLKDGINQVMKPNVRKRLKKLGLSRAKKFSWNSPVNAYAELYERLMAK